MESSPQVAGGYPESLSQAVVLANGVVVMIRPIRAEDASLEVEFLGGLSSESRYQRFLYELDELTDEMLTEFTQIDYQREMALIAVLELPDGPRQVGVARYSVASDGHSCGFAIVVGDAWRGTGLAQELLGRLVRIARERGVRIIEGVSFAGNRRMQGLARALGFETLPDPEDRDLVRMRMALQAERLDAGQC
jgi:acetyltransferase